MENNLSQDRAIDLTGDYKDTSSDEVVQKDMHDKIKGLLEDEDLCMLTTSDLNSRPMQLQQHDPVNNCLWFFASKDSKLALAIQENSSVNAAFSSESNSRYLSMKGTAAVVVDREKIDELWSRLIEVWYPLGKADPNLCLVRIDIKSVEAWMGPETKMEELYRVGKSLITGNNVMDDSFEHFQLKYRN